MAQMYKVFINDKPVILTPHCDLELLSNHMVYIRYDDFEELHFLITLLEDTELQGAVIYSAEFDLLWADFRAHFREVDAAGGVLRNPEGKILLIERLGKWDLPKGKIDENESPLEAALREVHEECGIDAPEPGPLLGETYHTYTFAGCRYLKRTYWYDMYTSQEQFVLQAEEHITSARWLHPEEIDWGLMETYASIRQLMDEKVLY